jgi:hypothetical protein
MEDVAAIVYLVLVMNPLLYSMLLGIDRYITSTRYKVEDSGCMSYLLRESKEARYFGRENTPAVGTTPQLANFKGYV